MRATEIGKGTHKGDPDCNGQHCQHKYYCPVCHKTTKLFQSHENKDCPGTIIRTPRKKASNKQWELFNKKFIPV